MIEMIMTKGVPNPDEKSCSDCFYCQAAISWWCQNEEATKSRMSSIPGGAGCKYWKPCKLWSDLSWWERLWNNDIKITASELEEK